MKVFYFTIFIAISSLLGGCETMLPHYRLNDDFTRMVAAGVVTVNYCHKLDAMSVETVTAFNRSAARMLDAAVENSAVYNQTYNELFQSTLTEGTLTGSSLHGAQRQCKEYQSQMPQFIARMDSAYHSAVNTWASIPLVTPATQRNYYANPIPIIMPSGKVTFGMPQAETTNVMVNTSSGLVLCNVTNGVGNCY
jgi:hypothetical protein